MPSQTRWPRPANMIGRIEWEDEAILANIPNRPTFNGNTRLALALGRNDAIAPTFEDVSISVPLRVYPTVPAQVTVTVANVQDFFGGTGAQAVALDGIGTNGLRLTEFLPLDASLTTLSANTYRRINAARVPPGLTNVVNGANLGDITFTQTTPQLVMPATEGVTQSTNYSVPDNEYGIINRFHHFFASNQEAQLECTVRDQDGNQNFTTLRPFRPTITSESQNDTAIRIEMPQGCDAWCMARRTGGSAFPITSFYIIHLFEFTIV